MNDGIFITFEGADGSGKTTAITKAINFFEDLGFEVVRTREPGGSNVAEKIRDIILDKNNDVDCYTEALLYAASRAQHIKDTIRPALSLNKIVICDRFTDSSLAYQGVGRNLGIEEIEKLNEFATQGIMPNLTIFFDIHPKASLDRIQKNRKHDLDRLDLEDFSFHEKVYSGYKLLAAKFPKRIKTIDATKDIEAVSSSVINIIENYLKSNNISI